MKMRGEGDLPSKKEMKKSKLITTFKFTKWRQKVKKSGKLYTKKSRRENRIWV